MFKFLLYLFLIYFLVRFVFGRLFGVTIKSRVVEFHTHHHHGKSSGENDGKVNIHQPEKDKKGNDKNLGEYVDYEEVN